MKTESLLVKQPVLKDGSAKKKDDMKKKIKRYQEGGITINQQSTPELSANPQAPSASSGYFSNTTSTYPFQSSSAAPATTDTGSGVNQTFNIQPSAQSGQPVTTMKRGGKVKSASSRGDGCAIRGKTRA